jgi:hypothetical protein
MSVRQSLLKECGYEFVPRAGVQPLRGGGKSYIYHLGKLTVRYNVPPRGFDILKASPAQLREYNLPSRRILGSEWVAEMRGVSITPPPASLIEGPVKFGVPRCRTETGACWVGYVDTGHSNYDNASANWVEPNISPSVQGGTYSGSSADYITEAPHTYLANFGKIPLSAACSYYGSSVGYGVGQLSHTKVIMKDHIGHEMAQPGSIYGPNRDDFTMEDNHCS